MRGALPSYLTCGFILEEGLEVSLLEKIVQSMARTAEEAGVQIIAGDTKVVEGNGGLYINTTGVGFVPEGLDIAADRAEAGDALLVSGTMGDPVTFGCTEKDLQRLAYNEKKSFECAGVGPGSIVQLMVTLDKRFMAGLAYFLGIRELGAGVIRVGNGIPELQWDTIQRLKPDTIMCVPSFILRLVQRAEDHGIDYRNSSIKRIIGIGEGLREQDFSLNLLGRRIKEKWDVELYSTYSSTEMGATFSECPYSCGGHVHPELVIVEIIGPDNMPVPDGEVGEIVITTLGVEGMPLLRFRTGDIAAKITEPCKCGRNSFRLTPIVGRKNP